MKQLAFFAVWVTILFSCVGNQKQAASSDSAVELDQLMTMVEEKVDNTVTVVGFVTHTCKHSGKKCFIVGESQEVSFRIEAQGEIETFSPELIGSKLAVTGTVREQQLSREYIDELESEVVMLMETEAASEEACATELSNINDMRKWMKERDKDYYSIYYMDGLKYEVLD